MGMDSAISRLLCFSAPWTEVCSRETETKLGASAKICYKVKRKRCHQVMDSNSLLSEFFQNPIPFAAGFVAGLLKVDVNQDPVKGWLEQQGFQIKETSASTPSKGPQNISIE
jgi:hypothetical protein